MYWFVVGQFFPVNIHLPLPAEVVRNLKSGLIWIFPSLAMPEILVLVLFISGISEAYLRNTYKACFIHAETPVRLILFLSGDSKGMHGDAVLVAKALVGNCLDYCNSLFRSLSAFHLHRLQCVQNSLARIVANITKYSHITTVRKSLH